MEAYNYINTVKYQQVLRGRFDDEFRPDKGCEIFIKNVPFDATLEEFFNFCKIAGTLYEIRLMMHDDRHNRGFAYVSYLNKTTAARAIPILSKTPFRNNYYLHVEKSFENCTIFIGGIPTNKSRDQIWQDLLKQGVKNIIEMYMYRSYNSKQVNRGFVFVEFRTHEDASAFRAKYCVGCRNALTIGGQDVVVDWATPLPQVDEELLDKVKIIYVRNLQVSQPPSEFKQFLLHFTIAESIEKVFKHKNYSFIHMRSRDEAEILMKRLKTYYSGTDVEITWSKPIVKGLIPKRMNLSGSSNNLSSVEDSYQSSSGKIRGRNSDQIILKSTGIPQTCSSSSYQSVHLVTSVYDYQQSATSCPTVVCESGGYNAEGYSATHPIWGSFRKNENYRPYRLFGDTPEENKSLLSKIIEEFSTETTKKGTEVPHWGPNRTSSSTNKPDVDNSERSSIGDLETSLSTLFSPNPPAPIPVTSSASIDDLEDSPRSPAGPSRNLSLDDLQIIPRNLGMDVFDFIGDIL